MLSSLKKLVPVAAYFLPVVIFAQTTADLDSIGGKVVDLLDLVVPIIMTLALIYFFIGLAKYILSAGDDEKKGEGRNIMIWGVVALFVMASVWGLVSVLSRTFQVGQDSAPDTFDLIPR
ncbi:MAG: pilin [Patescibacteria group bacterium]